jgi:hypothetical protein
MDTLSDAIDAYIKGDYLIGSVKVFSSEEIGK